jgi:hypothetical protein
MSLHCLSATSSSEDLADWLELKALGDGDHSSSITDLARALQRSGTLEALDEGADADEDDEDGSPRAYASAPRSERSEVVCSDAFGELERRRDACRGPLGASAYPFEIQERSLRLEPGGARSVYTFLLLLSEYDKDAGPQGVDGAKLFEEVCAAAAQSYLGAPGSPAKSLVFGFPRRELPKSFPAAVDRLCQELGEGEGCRASRRTKDIKDGKVDLVAWRPFSDRRPSQIITFGQCATGKKWREKRTELQPKVFCDLFLTGKLLVEPVKTFFVPHQLEESAWEETSRFAGIVLDRCRIASLCATLEERIGESCAGWSQHVLRAGAAR